MTALARRRALLAALLLTAAVVLLDVAGSGLPARARALSAAAVGPVQRVLGEAGRADTSRLAEDNALLRVQLAQAQAQVAADAAAGRVLSSEAAGGGRLLATRVVAAAVTATGGHEVTVDVGQRDGVEPNVTVVAPEGLVGRVVTVGPVTSDVRLLDGRDATVAVRVGSGALGSVAASPPGDVPSRMRGELTLSLAVGSGVAVGDRVVTLGSAGGRPYAPDVLVGTVTAVDPPRGQQPTTAVVRPAADPTGLAVLAVLLPGSPALPAARTAS